MTDRKIQLGVGLDATPAKTGADEIVAVVQGMAVKVSQSAQGASKSIDGIGASATTAATRLERAQAAYVANIQRQIAAEQSGGKSTVEYMRLIAQQKGIAPEVAKPYLDQLEAVIAKNKAAAIAAGTFNSGLNTTGMTAKATNAALRQVPQQLTDIVVSLQGGQAPLTVLLQQGGQLKDIFGGIGAAARAMGGYLLSLVNPFTVVAAAAAVVAVAYKMGSEEADAYNRAIVLSGNAAGVTMDKLTMMASAISKTTGVTTRASAGALTEFVATGEIAADQLQKVTESAINLERYGGVAIAKSVEAFASLGKSPLAASIKLNESTHFLTTAVYEQIRSLSEQGRTYEAVQVAQNAYANATDTMVARLKDQQGVMQRGWVAIKDAIFGVGDALLAIGREDTSSKRIADLESRIKNRGNFNLSDSDVESMQKQIDYLRRVQSALNDVADAEGKRSRIVEARIKWDEKGLEFLTKEEKKKRDIRVASELGAASGVTPKEIADRVAAIMRDIPAEKANLDAKTALGVATVQKALEEELNVYENYTKQLDALYFAGNVSAADYYTAKKAIIELSAEASADALRVEIAQEKGREIVGNSQLERDTVRYQSDLKVLGLRQKLAKAIEDGDSKSVVITTQQIAAVDALARSYAQAEQAARSVTEAMSRGFDRERAGFGRSDLTRDRISGLGSIEESAAVARRAVENRRAFDKAVANDPARKAMYEDELKLIQSTADAQTVIWKAMYADRRAAEKDWTTGAKRALENYADNSENIAKGMEDTFTNAANNMGDAFASMTKNGILDFSRMTDSIISDLARIAAQKYIVGPMALTMLDMFGGSESGSVAGLDNAGAAFNAKGNVYSADTGLSAYRNTIVNKPTTFAFAQGVMGEKIGSPGEAIMPLSRMSGGDLGVKVDGGAGTTITYAPQINIDSRTDQADIYRNINQMLRESRAEMLDHLDRTRRR